MFDAFIVWCKLLEIIIGVLGFGLNLYILMVISFSRMTINSSILTCLSIAHCLFAFTIVIFNLIGVIVQNQATGQQWIANLFNIQNILWTIFPLWILWIICVLIIDRYLMITWPFQYKKKFTKYRCFVLLLFILVLLFINAPPLLISARQIGYDGKLFIFNITKLHRSQSSYCYIASNSFLVLSFLLPASIMIICNIHLLSIIMDHRNRIVSTIFVLQLNSGNYLAELNRQKQRDSLATIINLFCTLILVLPFFVNLTVQIVFNHFDPHLSIVSMLIISLTPLLNGYVYGLRCPTINDSFKRAIQRYLYRCQISQEIGQREIIRAAKSKTESMSSIFQQYSISNR